MAHPTNKPPAGAKAPCPICRAPSEAAFHPFCSRRCADVDLSRWLRGAYAIPVMDDDDEDGDALGRPIDPDERQGGDGGLH